MCSRRRLLQAQHRDGRPAGVRQRLVQRRRWCRRLARAHAPHDPGLILLLSLHAQPPAMHHRAARRAKVRTRKKIHVASHTHTGVYLLRGNRRTSGIEKVGRAWVTGELVKEMRVFVRTGPFDWDIRFVSYTYSLCPGFAVVDERRVDNVYARITESSYESRRGTQFMM